MLRLENVRVRFNQQLVLGDVSMRIAPARTTILIGRNGAGRAKKRKNLSSAVADRLGWRTPKTIGMSVVAALATWAA